MRRAAGWDAGTLHNVLFYSNNTGGSLDELCVGDRGELAIGTAPSTPLTQNPQWAAFDLLFLDVGSPTHKKRSHNSAHCPHVLHLSEDSESFESRILIIKPNL